MQEPCDLAPQKRAEKKEKQTSLELLSTKEYLEAYFNNTTDSIGVYDLNGRILKVNASFEKMFKEIEFTVPVKVLNDGTTNNDDRLGQVGDIQFVLDKEKINEARNYGLSIGIIREQMPFEEIIEDPYY